LLGDAQSSLVPHGCTVRLHTRQCKFPLVVKNKCIAFVFTIAEVTSRIGTCNTVPQLFALTPCNSLLGAFTAPHNAALVAVPDCILVVVPTKHVAIVALATPQENMSSETHNEIRAT